MKINIEANDTSMKVAFEGRLDALTAPELQAELDKHPLSKMEEIVVDAEKMEYISSAGLRTLLHAYRGMKMGGVLRIINANDIAKEVFKVTGFESLFSIE